MNIKLRTSKLRIRVKKSFQCLLLLKPRLQHLCVIECSVMASISLSFSSSLLLHDSLSKNTTFSTNPRTQNPKSRLVRCAFAAPAKRAKPTSSSSSVAKKRHWKEGEFPGISQTFIPGNSKKTPIKNLKKKLDRKNNAKAWANTVTEALSELIQKKQWLQALEVWHLL